MEVICLDRLKAIKDWCSDNGLVYIGWRGAMDDKLYYASKDESFSKYTYLRDVRRVIYSPKDISHKLLTSFGNMTSVSKKEYIEDHLNKNGISILGETPTKYSIWVKFKVTNGRFIGLYGESMISTLICDNFEKYIFQLLYDECKMEYFDKVAKNRGCKIERYPTELKMAGRAVLISPKGNIWETMWANFDRGNTECPEDIIGSKSSYGEKMVASILDKNSMKYIYEYKITHKDESYQYMDFYVENCGKRICIEYNGIQHYEEVSWFSNTKLENIKDRDLKKKKYCKENDILFIEIPYTYSTPDKVFDYLQNYIDIQNVPTGKDVSMSLGGSEIDDEIVIDYFKKHTQKETAKHFGFSTGKLNQICVRNNFKKGERSKPQKVIAIHNITGESVEFNSIKEASKYTGVCVKSSLRRKNQEKPTKNWFFKKVS